MDDRLANANHYRRNIMRLLKHAITSDGTVVLR
jgi:hypothetical protein